MARIVQSAEDFDEQLKAVRERPRHKAPHILAFFLFDERKSHQLAADFVTKQFKWLNSLADSSRMVLFFFLPTSKSLWESEEHVLVARSERTIKNPSLEIARAFGLGPADLPGVVFFTQLDLRSSGPHDGVFWPLDIDLFRGDAREAERVFSGLFTLVNETAGHSENPSDLMTRLRSTIKDEARREQLQPLLSNLRVAGIRLLQFPGKLIEAVAIAFGQEFARRAAGG
jgi:hypothetical protein